ncbi:pyridoxamine 5'-phosphate oxidase family protein [Crystallibacter degradans]|uniref:pyridoxamine 5'-phosphate oxidase family protein n=1 Tax=Crystallibacter degradans TaxID=2726743 RepID=UPI001475612A|nr:pyridoxamine 5'-phosphate oxidase family protein [Arthrobacter sp. SF27]NMR28671.1 pyridoxamine 5'-phosphate oxidase family protein [Arthrobacter sp. SF27]
MQNKSSRPTTEVLETHQCWKMLHGVSLGRLAAWVDDHPELFPINFRIDQETIIFRTGPGTKLSAVLQGAPVAFEVDSVDSSTNVAWSVVVKGQAAELEQAQALSTEAAQHLLPWEAGAKDHFVRITPTEVTGRRFTVAHPHIWDITLDDATRAGLE